MQSSVFGGKFAVFYDSLIDWPFKLQDGIIPTYNVIKPLRYNYAINLHCERWAGWIGFFLIRVWNYLTLIALGRTDWSLLDQLKHYIDS